jgi:starch synthase
VISSRRWQTTPVARAIQLRRCGRPEKFSVSRTQLPNGRVPVYLINQPRYLGSGGIYLENTAFVGSFREIQRFLFFSQAALAMLPQLNWWPEIIHCQDWHVAALPALLRDWTTLDPRYQSIRTLLTIHNLANQGQWPAREILDFLCPAEPNRFVRRGRSLNLIGTGLVNADAVNTVSRTYAKEIATRRYGEGLDGVVRRRRTSVHGIVNGVDDAAFNPQRDPELARRFSARTIDAGKAANKRWLQRHLRLTVADRAPLFGLVSRLTGQKGIDLVLAALPEILHAGGQVAFLGVGDPKLERRLERAAVAHPRQIATAIRFDVALAKQIYAGSDLFLMPSRFEPCGLGQLIAMRYGTLPIVRSTGGLKDTVRPYHGGRVGHATGFAFDRISADSLRVAIRQALAAYGNPTVWQQLRRNAIGVDSSWETAAKEYKKLYLRLRRVSRQRRIS